MKVKSVQEYQSLWFYTWIYEKIKQRWEKFFITNTNNIKKSSNWKSEQHHSAPWKLHMQCNCTKCHRVSLQDRPRYLLLGMVGAQWQDCDHPSWKADRLWFFVLKDNLYLGFYPLSRSVLSPMFHHIVQTKLFQRPWFVKVVVGLVSQLTGKRKLWEGYSSQAAGTLQTNMLCAPFQFIFFIMMRSMAFLGWRHS